MQRASFARLLACLCAIASAAAVTAAAAPKSDGQVADGTIQTAASLCDHMPRVAQEAYQLFNANRVAAARKKKAEIDVLFARAIAIDPSHAPCYATAAQIALGTHEFERAMDLFGRAGLLFAAKGDIDAERVAQRGKAFAELGKMSTERDAAYRGGQGNITLALELTRRQIKYYPDCVHYRFDAATMQVARSEIDSAAAAEAMEFFASSHDRAMRQLHYLVLKPDAASGRWPALDCKRAAEAAAAAQTQPVLHVPTAEGIVHAQGVFLSGPDALHVSARDCSIFASTGGAFVGMAVNLPLPNPARPGALPPLPPISLALAAKSGDGDASPLVFSMVGYASASFYHFVCESLPRLLAMRDELNEASLSVLRASAEHHVKLQAPRVLLPNAGFARAWFDFALDAMRLDASGARPVPIAYVSDGPFPRVYVDRLVTYVWPPHASAFESSGNTDSPTPQHSLTPLHLLRSMRDTLVSAANAHVSSPEGNAAAPYVLWLTRAPGAQTSSRALANEAAVLDALRLHFGAAATVRTLDPGAARLSPAETVRLFSRAHAVVGVHGGALANIAFCARGTIVVELAFRSPFLQHYRHVSHALGLRYAAALLVADERGAGAREVVADVAAVRAALVEATARAESASRRDEL